MLVANCVLDDSAQQLGSTRVKRISVSVILIAFEWATSESPSFQGRFEEFLSHVNRRGQLTIFLRSHFHQKFLVPTKSKSKTVQNIMVFWAASIVFLLKYDEISFP